MANKHLTQSQKETIKAIAEECGFAEVLLLLDGLIRQHRPENTAENWANGTLGDFDHIINGFTSLRHLIYNRIDKKG